jgi:hypothetical protein
MVKQLTLAEAGAILGRKPDSLRRQAGRGVLVAEKLGRDWITTDAAVRDYARNHLRSNARRGVPILEHAEPDTIDGREVITYDAGTTG